MTRTLVYKNKAGQRREFEFEGDVEEVEIVGDRDSDYYVAIGFRDGKENQVVNGIDEVVEKP